jgi:hypothetical protein
MLDTYLVEPTRITAKGDGAVVDVSAASSPVILLSLQITAVIEQESIDVSVFGAPDENSWGKEPVATFPQLFYAGDYPILLDLRDKPEVRFLRAHWDVNRWGRGAETAQFDFSLRAREVPLEMLKR